MSTATLNRTGTPAPRSARPGLLHGPAWLVWRQHRAAAWTGLGLLLVVVGLSVWLHHATGTYLDSHHIRGCSYFRGPAHCADGQRALEDYRALYRDPAQAVLLLVTALPVLAGLFVGAPLIARELEAGTHQLVWSQSVTRGRWLAYKLALPLLAVGLGSAVAGLCASWLLAGAGQATIGLYWYASTDFVAAGPAVVGYSLFTVALGAAVGVLVRKTVTSMVLTLAGTGVAFFALQSLRSHLMPLTERLAKGAVPIQDTTWLIETHPATAGGRAFPKDVCMDAADFGKCLKARGATHQYAGFHPVSHMRELQFVEGGICVVLAALLVGLAWWWLRRRTV
ncbi:ABC transporter permease subunit [Streptomyces sp. NPDC049954]|uniref:ABC transporter permease subunit n=1 Tax=Streptomyces sp. NPDC049954 TaxID=3155779 RepID=UPI00343BC840